MPAKNPATIAQKWKDRIQAAQKEMEDGVRAVTTAPSQQAIANQEAMKIGFLNALQSGKWAKNLGKTTLGDWQQSMIQIGIPRAVQGASDKLAKTEKFLTKFLPYVDNVKKQIKAMPNVTDADKKARMLKNYELMKGFSNA